MSVLSDFLAGVKSTASKAKAGAKKVSSYLPKAGDFASGSKVTTPQMVKSGAKKAVEVIKQAELRGFTPEQVRTAKPTLKEGVKGLSRSVAEIPAGLGYLSSLIGTQTQAKIADTKFGGKLADIGAMISEYSVPKTPGEAKAMIGFDVATLPFMAAKTASAPALLSKANTPGKVSKIIKGMDLTVSDDIIQAIAKESDQAKVSSLLNIGIEDSNFRRSVAAGLSQRAAQLEKEIAIANQAPVLDFAKIAKLEQEKIDIPKMMKDLPKMDKDSVFEMNKFLNTRNIDAFKINEQGLASGSLPGRIELPKADPLLQEAGKYKSAEDFVNSLTKQKYTPTSEYFQSKGLSKELADYASLKASEMQDMRSPTFMDIAQGKFKNFITGKRGTGDTTIYRAVPKGEKINISDMVFTDRKMAEQYQIDHGFKRGQQEIVSQKIDGADLMLLREDAFPGEAVYFPKSLEGIKTKSQLTDLYNKAQGGKTLKGFVGGGKLPKDAPASKIMDFLRSKPKGQKERGLSRQIRNSPEITLDLAKRVEAEGLKYTAKKNSSLIKKAQEVISTDPMEAERIAKTGLNDEAVAIGSEYIKELGLAAQRTKDVATRNALLDKAVEIASIQAERLTEAGRAVQAASIISKLSPEGVLRYASTLIKKAGSDVKITADQAEKLLAHAKKIEGITDPTERAKEMFKLFDSINELIPSSLGEQMVAVWKAGLLTGLKTTGINIFSNIVHGVSEIVKDIPAATVDSVLSLFTGQRTKTLGVKGLGGGLKEGFEKGWEYLRTGFDERNIGAKLDYKKVNFGTSKVGKGLQKYEELVFRTIGSEDQPFYYGAKARSLYDQAAAKAINGKVPKAERAAFIEDLVQNPTDDMIEISVRDAETAVFSRDNVLARAATGLARPLGATGDFIMPFKKTPSNVLLQALNYTPAGPVMEIAKQIKAGKFDQRMLSEAIGRGTVGTGVFALGGMLAADGLITAKAPDSETERKQWELEGKQANSISFDGGNTWKSLSALGPIGTVMIIGAYYQNALKETGSRTEAMKAAIAGAGRATVDQTFLKGVSGALNALNDPTRGLSMFVENTVGSTIPTIIADIARAKDTTKREVNGAAESIINRIPGWRETLPEKLDVFGKPIAEANGLAVMVDIFRTSKRELSSPEKETVSELSRLAKAGYTATPANIKKNQTINGVETIIDQKQINDFKKQFGEDSLDKLKTLIESRDYKNSSDEDKANMIDSVVSEAKRIAKIKVLGEEGSNKDQARILHEELKKLPKDEANAVAEEIRSRDKKVFESLKSVVMEEKAGITPKDKQLRSLGVENGERARTIYDEVSKLKTNEEKNSYIEELRKKKVISDAVMKQLRQIIREEKEMQAQE